MADQTNIPASKSAPTWLWALLTPFVLLVALHGMVSITLGAATRYSFDPGMADLLLTVAKYIAPWIVYGLLIRTVVLVVWDRSKTPLADVKAILANLAADRERLLGGVFRMAVVAFLVGSFGYQKELVSVVQNFGWDETFARMDRVLHFGVDPYAWLLPLFGAPLVVTAINAAYHAWFFLIYVVVFLACFAPGQHRASLAFLIGLALTFAVGGNILAMVFSSAGPVYYERLGLGSDFVPLMAHLAEVAKTSPVWALDVQEGLWDGHMNDGQLAGISAMPSMHVATSVLMALYAMQWRRWAGWTLWVFAGVIMIGSVLLGWHYAVDGYLGALIAWAAWRAGMWLADRHTRSVADA